MTRDLIRRARVLWPHSKSYRRQWIRNTMRLLTEGKHILHGGERRWGNTRPRGTP